MLFKEIENRGLLETGIYRVPGENRVMQAMQAKLNAGQELDFKANPSFSDPHNLASLTKLWLRELPEIISPTFYSAFIQANNIEGYEERLCTIRDLVWSLPATSFHLLDRLCEHLHLIAEHELENQMHASNLAIVFAPTILRPPEGSDSYAILMSNLGKAAKLVSSLIVQHNWIFSGQEPEEEAEVEPVDRNDKLPEDSKPTRDDDTNAGTSSKDTEKYSTSKDCEASISTISPDDKHAQCPSADITLKP
ncbi:Rho GTPase activation protein [Cystobasidium minutum MCA 4210]|uniref:Rho GTPase activation protein n=1 Tax=Cystobasidium minutum MCA 4210 TaxID=1397322 RepID=UPI0034CFAC74|eukprot:jgi/Rhomi1/168429/fgenesh1_kg.2_\